ncbi:substrate-binding domain-containing protein [Hydrogenophaga sp.]|uniref:substrate-binding domain-containing protein n=1 Tax=Hydrogenophaga sp. TaxID=1904254 RepID=UPI0025C43365|nr:substrate-binding domain-containing protein [Hydrogenophaga sp.]
MNIRMISSMATQALLSDLNQQFQAIQPDTTVSLVSVGGVSAAERVQAGETFDVVVLAANAIDQLSASGQLLAESRIDLARSDVALAIRADSPVPDIRTEANVKAAVLAAASVGISTGPSGVAVNALFERWGMADVLRERIVTAPPGVAVGSLVASGEVALGFQQLSELKDLPGITVLGPLPSAIQIITTFSAARTMACEQPEAVQALLAFLASAATADSKQAHGMSPA